MSTVYCPANATCKGYAIFNTPAEGDTDVDLQSLDITKCTVPSTVTILDGDYIGEYEITWVDVGTTAIRMSHDSIIKDLTVICLPVGEISIYGINVEIEVEEPITITTDVEII